MKYSSYIKMVFAGLLTFWKLVVCPAYTYAQDPYYISFKEKTPRLNTFTYMPDGHMVFGSSWGIKYYDGSGFTEFSISEGLPSAEVYNTNLDSKGRLWIRTSAGLAYMKDHKITSLSKKINDQLKALPYFTREYYGPNDTIYLEYDHEIRYHNYIKIIPNGHGGWDSLQVIRRNPLMILRNEDNPSEYVCEVKVEFNDTNEERKLDIAFENDTISYIVPTREGYSTTHAKSSGDVASIAVHNKIFVVTEGKVVNHYTFESLIFMAEIKYGELWVYLLDGGIAHFKKYDQTTPPDYYFTKGEGKDNFYMVEKDRFGGYWLGSNNTVCRYVPCLENTSYRADEHLEPWIDDIHLKNDTLFIGHYDNSAIGILTRDISKERIIYKEEPSMFHVRDFVESSSGFYASTTGRLLKFNSSKTTFEVVSNKRGGYFSKYNDTIMWANLGQGITRIVKDSLYADLHSNLPFTYQFRRLGIGTYLSSANGLWEYTNDTVRKVFERNTFYNQENFIYPLKDQWWVITSFGAGICLTNAKDSLYLSKKDGLKSDFIYSVYQDRKGTIWIGTNEGISILEVSENLKHYSVQNLDKEYYYGTTVHGFFEAWGKFWGYTESGIFSIELPHKPSDLQIALNDVITDASYENGQYVLGNDPDNDFITIKYQGMLFRRDEPIEYEYQLTGINTSWVKTKDDHITFRGLPEGSYSFRVRVSGANNISKPITFVVPTPFWKTWWFMLLILAGLALGFYAVFLIRLRQITLRNSWREELNRYQQQALSAQMNPHFIFNSLNSIQRFIMENEKSLSSRYLSNFSSLMRIVLNNSNEKLISLEKELKALELYLELESLRFKNKLKYSIEISEEVDESDVMIPPSLLQPFIENAIWHGIMHKKDGGTLQIKFVPDENKDNVLCIIQDDGIGREKSAKLKQQNHLSHKSQGMDITRRRVDLANRLYHFKLKIRVLDLYDPDGNASGTRVELVIPPISNDTNINKP